MTDKEVPVEQLLAQMGREIHLAEPTKEREERRARVVRGLRELHVRVLDERGRGRRTRRVAVGLMAAALLVITGSALAAAAGLGPLASMLPRAEVAPPYPANASRPAEPTRERKSLPGSSLNTRSAPEPESTLPPAPSLRSASSDARPALRVPASAQPSSEKEGELTAVNRLFAEAKRARRENRDAEALLLFQELLAKYPRSVLAHEASVERFRALSRLGRTADAKRYAAAYLSRYQGGYAEEEARRLVGTSGKP
jgi:hypothetical protein